VVGGVVGTMIRDDFSGVGSPNPAVWVSLGSPKVADGMLYLGTSGDGVRSKTKITLDDAARATVVVLNGSGAIYLTPYEVDTRPDTLVPKIPFYKINYRQSGNLYSVTISNQDRTIADATIAFKLKILAKCSGNTINFIGVGKDEAGKDVEFLIASVPNQFYNLSVALYLFGGATNIDYVEAGSGRELQVTFFYESLMPTIMAIVPLVLMIAVIRIVLRSVKELGVH
jgi:hypothetical protein